MKKFATKIVTVLAACAALAAFVSCSSPSSSDSSNSSGASGSSGDAVVLFEDAAGWSEDWVTKSFDAAKFANATNDSVIAMEVSKDTDRLISGTDPATMYNECYAIIQLLDYSVTDGKFGAGTSNTTIENAEQLNLRGANGLFEDSDINTTFKTVTYKPTAAEWAKIKENGLGIQAHGTMFKKIELR